MKKSMIAISFLSLLLSVFHLQADADWSLLERKATPWLNFEVKESSVDELCEDTVDLRESLPPVRNQKNSPWCAAYTTADVLYAYHKINFGFDEYPSIIEISSMGNKSAPGHFPLNKGVNERLLFSNLRHGGKVALEEELPFDPSFFEYNQAWKAEAIRFYQNKINNQRFSRQVFQLESDLYKMHLKTIYYEEAYERFLEASRPVKEDDFLRFAIPRNQNGFLSQIALPFSELKNKENPWKKSKSATIKPYNLFRVQDIDRDDSLDFNLKHILYSLNQRASVAVGLCFRSLESFRETGKSELRKGDRCGAHAMSIVGKRKSQISGKCELLVRNSHGEKWAQEGYYWLQAQELKRVMFPYKKENNLNFINAIFPLSKTQKENEGIDFLRSLFGAQLIVKGEKGKISYEEYSKNSGEAKNWKIGKRNEEGFFSGKHFKINGADSVISDVENGKTIRLYHGSANKEGVEDGSGFLTVLYQQDSRRFKIKAKGTFANGKFVEGSVDHYLLTSSDEKLVKSSRGKFKELDQILDGSMILYHHKDGRESQYEYRHYDNSKLTTHLEGKILGIDSNPYLIGDGIAHYYKFRKVEKGSFDNGKLIKGTVTYYHDRALTKVKSQKVVPETKAAKSKEDPREGAEQTPKKQDSIGEQLSKNLKRDFKKLKEKSKELMREDLEKPKEKSLINKIFSLISED